jgi:ATP-binding cassette subfamily B protein
MIFSSIITVLRMVQNMGGRFMKKLFGGVENLFFLIKPYWKYGKMYLLGRFALALFIAPALSLIQVMLVQSIIDAIIAGMSMKETIMIAATLVAGTLGLTVIKWTFLLLYDRWKAEDMRIKINRGIYEQAIKTDYKYFDNPDFYNSFTLATGELAIKSESALQLLTEVAGILSVAIAMSAYLATLGPWIIVIIIVESAICLFAQRIIQKLGIKRTMESLPFERKLNYIHRIAYQKQYSADMKSSDLPQKLLSIFDKSGHNKVLVWKKLAKPNTWANMLQFFAWQAGQLAQLAYLIYCVFARGLGVGAVTGMFTAAIRLHDMLNQFVSFTGRAMEVSLYTDRIRAFYKYESEIETQIAGIEPPSGAFSLELRGMSFAYPNSDFALKNISINIMPGEKIAIVGENGAGKTTLAKLLLRLYDVDSGEVLYNGFPARDYNIHTLRRKIGVAFQDPQLYAMTARENMEIYNAADDDTLNGILRKVGLDIRLDKEVTREFDDTGAMFSGGQAQKLGLTRLLHGDFGLLLLDEPSSALDPLAEYEMTKLIFEQSKTTTIMVAHRLSTIRDADRIFLIANGGVAESGTHNELMILGGTYAEMFTKQAERYVK